MIGTVVNAAILAVFGEDDVVLCRAGQPDRPVRAVFESRPVTADLGGETPVTGMVSTLGLSLSEFGEPRRDDEFLIRGVRYAWSDKHPDSDGWVVLTLERRGDA